jgi:hypothetical protein
MVYLETQETPGVLTYIPALVAEPNKWAAQARSDFRSNRTLGQLNVILQ